MHSFLKLLTPEKSEVVLYLVSAWLLMLSFVGGDLWHKFLATQLNDQQTYDTISVAIRQAIDQSTHLSNPQIINAVIWGVTAGTALCIVGAVLHFVRLTREDAQLAKVGVDETGFWTKLLIRLGAIIALAMFAILFAAVILPATLLVFETRVLLVMDDWINLPLVVGSLVATAASLYVFSLLCRLIALRIRVFSELYE